MREPESLRCDDIWYSSLARVAGPGQRKKHKYKHKHKHKRDSSPPRDDDAKQYRPYQREVEIRQWHYDLPPHTRLPGPKHDRLLKETSRLLMLKTGILQAEGVWKSGTIRLKVVGERDTLMAARSHVHHIERKVCHVDASQPEHAALAYLSSLPDKEPDGGTLCGAFPDSLNEKYPNNEFVLGSGYGIMARLGRSAAEITRSYQVLAAASGCVYLGHMDAKPAGLISARGIPAASCRFKNLVDAMNRYPGLTVKRIMENVHRFSIPDDSLYGSSGPDHPATIASPPVLTSVNPPLQADQTTQSAFTASPGHDVVNNETLAHLDANVDETDTIGSNTQAGSKRVLEDAFETTQAVKRTKEAKETDQEEQEREASLARTAGAERGGDDDWWREWCI